MFPIPVMGYQAVGPEQARVETRTGNIVLVGTLLRRGRPMIGVDGDHRAVVTGELEVIDEPGRTVVK
jgi:hypothetical protein